MRLIDIGVNLTNPRLYSNREQLKSDAINIGIVHQIITGTCLESSRQASNICQEDPTYYSSTAGCHPHDAKDFRPEHLQELRELLMQRETVAVGECGLDFNRNYSPQETQIDIFKLQIELAIETQMPLFMHQRDAHDTFIATLKPYQEDLVGGVVHCFTGTKTEMMDYLDMGLYVGITGWLCDERRGDDLRAAVRHAPLDRILLETDAPYLLPRTIRPKPKSRTNVPANLPWVVSELAGLVNTTPENIASQTSVNCQRLFKLDR